MQIVPSNFCHNNKELLWPSKYAKIRFWPGLCPIPSGELRTFPQTHSRLERGTPPYTSPHSVPTHLRRSPCVPQNSSQIYAYMFPLSCLKIPGLFQDCRSPATDKQQLLTVYTVRQYNPSQNVYHTLQRNCSVKPKFH